MAHRRSNDAAKTRDRGMSAAVTSPGSGATGDVLFRYVAGCSHRSGTAIGSNSIGNVDLLGRSLPLLGDLAFKTNQKPHPVRRNLHSIQMEHSAWALTSVANPNAEPVKRELCGRDSQTGEVLVNSLPRGNSPHFVVLHRGQDCPNRQARKCPRHPCDIGRVGLRTGDGAAFRPAQTVRCMPNTRRDTVHPLAGTAVVALR